MAHKGAVNRNQPSGVSSNPVVTRIAYIYLMRVPILVGVVLLLLPLLARFGARPLLQNLFVLSFWGTVWSTAMALALCWSILLTSRVVRLNGDRFGLPVRLTVDQLKSKYVFLSCLLAAPLILAQFVEWREFGLDRNGILVRIAAVIGGAVIAYLVALGGLFLTVLAAPKKLFDTVLPGENSDTSRDSKKYPFPIPCFLRRGIEAALGWANEQGVSEGRLSHRLRDYRARGFLTGYLDPDTGMPWEAQWMAFTAALAFGVLMFALDVVRLTYLGESSLVPALCYIVILLLNANWVLAFFAFLLDHYRLPLLVPLALLCVAGAHAPSSDHYYSSQDGVPIETITPYDVLHARHGKPVILVATAGGGIQASAWTAEVLSRLEQLSNTDWKTPDSCSFADALTLVSAVSGGATGSMYFLNLYGPDSQAAFHGQEQDIDGMMKVVEESSLDDIGWALAYHDLARIVLPYSSSVLGGKLLDRGYMLEENWRNRGGIHANLSNWRAGVKEGRRPAVIFNSTVAETGEPMLLSNTDLAAPNDEPLPRRRNFYSLYHNMDVPVVTAVRLAATFPYVTPAARIVSGKPENHMIDGGYYDNPGVASLVEWIDEGLRALEKNKEPIPDHILIIQIRSFPDETTELAPTNRGWFFQAYAPLKGLLGVRTAAQLVRDRRELETLARLWSYPQAERGSLADRVRFATFTFDGTDAPLSWAMNQSQKDAIATGWTDFAKKNPTTLQWVHCTLDAKSPDCSRKEKKGPW
jgi:hypothetical protein